MAMAKKSARAVKLGLSEGGIQEEVFGEKRVSSQAELSANQLGADRYAHLGAKPYLAAGQIRNCGWG
jgi:hypothetical protein